MMCGLPGIRKRLLPLWALGALLAGSGVASAEDATACNEFAWSLAKERSLFTAADLAEAESGAKFANGQDIAVKLKLKPVADVTFTQPPDRTPAKESFAGTVTVETIATAGTYQVTLSAKGWVDAIQNGAKLKAAAHTGKEGCPEIHKSVRFVLGPGPLTVQISNIAADSVLVAIRPAE